MGNVQIDGPQAPLPERSSPKNAPFTRQKEVSNRALAALAIANVQMSTPNPKEENRSSLWSLFWTAGPGAGAKFEQAFKERWSEFKNSLTPGVGFYAMVGNLEKLVSLAKKGKISAKNIHKLSKEQLAHLKKSLSVEQMATLKRAAETSIASRLERQTALIHFIHDNSYEQAALSFANQTLDRAFTELSSGQGLSKESKENVDQLRQVFQKMDFATRMELFGKLTLSDLTNAKLEQLFPSPLNIEIRLAECLKRALPVDESFLSHLKNELEKLQPLRRIELMAQWKIPEDIHIKRLLENVSHTVNHLIVNDWNVACLISKQVAVDHNRKDLQTFLHSLEPLQRISLMMQWGLKADDPVLKAVRDDDQALVTQLQNDARKAHNFTVIQQELQSGISLHEIIEKYGATLQRYLPEGRVERASFLSQWKLEMKGTALEHLFTPLLFSKYEGLLESFTDEELGHVKSYLQEMNFLSRLSWMSSWKPLRAPQIAASRIQNILDKIGFQNDLRIAQGFNSDSDAAHLKKELAKLNPPTERERQQLKQLSKNKLLENDPNLKNLLFKLRVESFLTSRDPHVHFDFTTTEYSELFSYLQGLTKAEAEKYVNRWTIDFSDKEVREVFLLPLAEKVPAVKKLLFEKRITPYLQSPQGKESLHAKEIDFLVEHLKSMNRDEKAAYLACWNSDTNQQAQEQLLDNLVTHGGITSVERDEIYLRNFHAGISSSLTATAKAQIAGMAPAEVLQKASRWNIEDQAHIQRQVTLPVSSLKAPLEGMLTAEQIVAYQIAKGRPVDATFQAEDGSVLVTCLLAMDPDKRFEYLKKCEFNKALCKQLLKDNPALYYDYMRSKGLPITEHFLVADAPSLKQYLETLDPSIRHAYLALCSLSHNMFQFKYLGDLLTLEYMTAKKIPLDHNSPSFLPAHLKSHLESLSEAIRSDYLKLCDFDERQLNALGDELTAAYHVAKGIPVTLENLNSAQFAALKKQLLTKSPEERQAYLEKCHIDIESILLKDPELRVSAMRARIHCSLSRSYKYLLSSEEIAQLNTDLATKSVAQRVALMHGWPNMRLFSQHLQPKFRRELQMTEGSNLFLQLLPKTNELQEFADCLSYVKTPEQQKAYVSRFCLSLLTHQKETLFQEWNVDLKSSSGKLLFRLLPEEFNQEKYEYLIQTKLLPFEEEMANFVGHLFGKRGTADYSAQVKSMADELQKLPYQEKINYLSRLDLDTQAAQHFLQELWNHNPQLVALSCLTKKMKLSQMQQLLNKEPKVINDTVSHLLYDLIGQSISPDLRLLLLQQLHIDPSLVLREDLGEFRRFQMILAEHKADGADVIVPLLLAVTANKQLIIRELRTLREGYKDSENIALVDALLQHKDLR